MFGKLCLILFCVSDSPHGKDSAAAGVEDRQRGEELWQLARVEQKRWILAVSTVDLAGGPSQGSAESENTHTRAAKNKVQMNQPKKGIGLRTVLLSQNRHRE